MIRGFVGEGRTVLLSSHLLDEVEKICDQVAIVDRGLVVMQGSIAELAAGDERTILVATGDDERPLAILSEHRAVASAAADPPLRAGARVARAAVPGDHVPTGGGSMNAQALTGELPLATRRSPWVPRLVSAEFLKLRKRRGLVATAVVLTVGAMLIAYAVLLGLHASDPVEYGVAGGMENFVGSMGVLSLLSVVAAILVGATLGTGDVGAGVFRELVVTGRSRFALFAARVPAGLGLLLPIVGAAFAITTGASTAFAGSKGAEVVHVGPGAWENTLGNVAPNAGLLLESAGWLALVTVAGFLLALGVSSLLGSRATSIGLLLAWWLVAMPLLLGLGALGSLREALIGAALERFMPDALGGNDPYVAMSLAAAIVVLLVWAVVPLALGAWRTSTRDA